MRPGIVGEAGLEGNPDQGRQAIHLQLVEELVTSHRIHVRRRSGFVGDYNSPSTRV